MEINSCSLSRDGSDVPGDSALQAIVRRDRLVIVGGIIVLTLASWGYLFYDAHRMAAGEDCCHVSTVDARSWLSVDLLLLFVMWAIMMVAMMAPTAGPMVLTFAAVNRRRHLARRPYVPTGFFLLGYLVTWTLFSAAATALQWWLHSRALMSPAMLATSRALGGGILVSAGVFQLLPLKRRCLSHCRSPLAFMMSDWREGIVGALSMGLRHGIFCLGCCWILMMLLFVTGVMNLLWVAILTGFVLVEKIMPPKFRLSAVAGIFLIAWGAVVWLR